MLLLVQPGVEQEPAHADDRVQRRADLVAHGCKEAALCLVRLFGGLARLLRLREQSGVLERDGGLLRHAGQEAQVGRRERAPVAAAPDGEDARDCATHHEGGGHELLFRVVLRALDVNGALVGPDPVDRLGASGHHDVPDDPLPRGDRRGADLVGDGADGYDGAQGLGIGIGQVHRAGVRVEQRACAGRDELQDPRELQGCRHLASDLGQGGHLFRPATRLVVQTGILDGDADVGGNGRQQALVG